MITISYFFYQSEILKYIAPHLVISGDWEVSAFIDQKKKCYILNNLGTINSNEITNADLDY